MFLVPRAYYWRKGSAAFDVAPPAPSFETLSSDDFLPIYVKRKRPGGVGRVKITPPNTTASFDVAVKASLSNSRAARKGFAFDQTIVFAFSRNEISQAITAFQADNPVDGSAFLTLTAPSTFKFDSRTFTRSSISVSFLGGATVVSRKSVPTTLEIYADADL